jgi:hypothetical protein
MLYENIIILFRVIISLFWIIIIHRKEKRGRPPSVPPEVLIKIVMNHQTEIVKSLSEKTIVQPSHPIWQTLIDKYELPVSSKSIYEFARKRKTTLFESELLGNDTNTTIRIPSPESLDSRGNHTNDNEEGSSDDANVQRFSISLSPTKWSLIKPIDREYRRNDDPERRTRHRAYMTLKPGVWTDIINKEVWKKGKFKCAWAFKRAKVFPNSITNYLVIVGKCTKCHALFKASCYKEPLDGEGIVLAVSVRGVRDSSQHPLSKRQLKGHSRTLACDSLIKEQKTASLLRKEYASEEMAFLDPEPSHLPSLEVLRKAKSNKLTRDRLDENPLTSLGLLKYTDPYRSVILAIGQDPFFVHYWTTEQLRIFTAYSNKAPFTKMCIDATGSLVRKLTRPGGTWSGHIFLYTGVISLPGEHEGQVPVLQMLSERHNANAITFWLCEWLRTGGKIPDVVVCDYSVALLSSISRAFALTSSTRAYCDVCFKILSIGPEDVKVPSTYLRVDVAHFIKSVTRWKCLRNRDQRIREFYVRGVARLVLSTTLLEAKTIILALLVVSLTSTEGMSQSTGRRVPCEKYKQKMKELYSTADVNNLLSEINEEDGIDDDSLEANEEDLSENCMMQWVHKIKVKSIKLAKIDDGDRDNILQLKKLPDTLCRVCYDLPLWSAVMLSTFNRGNVTASSAPVESYFNDLKTRHLKPLIPMRVDQFIIKHLNVTDGAMKLAGSSSFLSTAEPSMELTFPLGEKFESDPFISTQTSSLEMLRSPSSFTPDKHPMTSETFPSTVQPTGDASSSGNHPLNQPTKEQTHDLPAGILAYACIACAIGNFPEGAHKCLECRRGVHLISECSILIGEKGYGEQRLCRRCIDKPTANWPSTKQPELLRSPSTFTPDQHPMTSETFPSTVQPTGDASSSGNHPLNQPTKEQTHDLPAGIPAYACIACAMGNFPEGAHKCLECGRGVHLISECSILIGEKGYGEQRLCRRCMEKPTATSSSSTKNNFERATNSPQVEKKVEEYIGEMAALENWKGKGGPSSDRGLPIKKRKKSFYLTTSPEWRLMDDSKLKGKVKIGLLKNGNAHSLKAVKIGKELLSLRNTCAYDSVVQVLAVYYCDSEAYREFADQLNEEKGTLGLAMQIAIR